MRRMSEYITTKIDGYRLKHAEVEDSAKILQLIKELAGYENMTNLVKTTEEDIRKYIFEEKVAGVVFGEYQGEVVGYILFFYNFSTFNGKPGLYLEDLFIKPEFRKLGFGKLFFEYLGYLAKKKGCKRLEWTCLDWNEPSIQFYKARGGKALKEWNLFRMDGESLELLSGDFAEEEERG